MIVMCMNLASVEIISHIFSDTLIIINDYFAILIL